MKKHILIYGAGAIGRGYIPWIFNPEDYDFSYVETNSTLRSQLKKQLFFTSFCTKDNGYVSRTALIQHIYAPGEELTDLDQFSAIITAVGPRHVLDLVTTFTQAKCPIILFENDDTLAVTLQKLLPKQIICFGIPDVITSNTAPTHLIEQDPLAIVTEEGVCFIDIKAKDLGGDCTYVSTEELEKQWLAKLYIHNTPHCIAAYLGALCKKTYLHEGMQNPQIYTLVKGAMLEMCAMLKVRHKITPEFIDWYAEKELKRFSNARLYDPISRVAREPFRKLAPDNRLIGAAQLALCSGIVPHNIIKGILCACLYNKKNDPDFNITYLVRALSPEQFLRLILKLNPNEALFKLLAQTWVPTIGELKRIAQL
jgi:mannitol-1-phosphate 5-dehydrogenase